MAHDKAIAAALIGGVSAVIAAVVGAAAAGWFKPDPTPEPDPPPVTTVTFTIALPPWTTTPPPTTLPPGRRPPTVDSPEPVVAVGPTMVVKPQIVSAGEYYTISGSGFLPGSGITLRFFIDESGHFPVADLLAVDQSGKFTFVSNEPFDSTFCGIRGAIAAFDESSDFSVADAPLGVAC